MFKSFLNTRKWIHPWATVCYYSGFNWSVWFFIVFLIFIAENKFWKFFRFYNWICARKRFRGASAVQRFIELTRNEVCFVSLWWFDYFLQLKVARLKLYFLLIRFRKMKVKFCLYSKSFPCLKKICCILWYVVSILCCEVIILSWYVIIRMPKDGTLTVRCVLKAVGDRLVEVVDVMTQGSRQMMLSDFVDYYE